MLWTPELLLKNCEGGEKRQELSLGGFLLKAFEAPLEVSLEAMRTLGGTLLEAFGALLEVSFLGFFEKVLLQDRVMQPREG